MIFENRSEAGKQLTVKLLPYKKGHPIILALPRGGVVTGFEVSKILCVPLDVLVTCKIGSPNDPEFGIGAVSEGKVKILDDSSIRQLRIPEPELKSAILRGEIELERRVKIYRGDDPFPLLKKKTVILVDDGIATGVTVRAAVASIRKQKPKMIILAAPVCAYETLPQIERLADKVICLIAPHDFSSVGGWYESFEQVSDEQVTNLLKQNRKEVYG